MKRGKTSCPQRVEPGVVILPREYPQAGMASDEGRSGAIRDDAGLWASRDPSLLSRTFSTTGSESVWPMVADVQIDLWRECNCFSVE